MQSGGAGRVFRQVSTLGCWWSVISRVWTLNGALPSAYRILGRFESFLAMSWTRSRPIIPVCRGFGSGSRYLDPVSAG